MQRNFGRGFTAGALTVLCTALSWAFLASGALALSNNITVQVSPTSIVADGTTTTTATATVKDSTNTVAVLGDAVTFSPNQVGATIDHLDGTYSATIKSSTTAGPVTVTAADASPASGTTTLTQTAGSATTITVAVLPTSIVADGTSTTIATATVKDANLNPVTTDNITFAPNQVGATVNHGDGTYTATIKSSTTAGNVNVTATDGSVTSAPSVLTQTPGPAKNITLALAPTSILADGASTSTATATVTDANGNAVASDNVSFSPNQVGATTNHLNGTYSATIKSSTTVGQINVTASDTTAGLSTATPLNQMAGQAASVTVQLSPAVILSNGISPTTATATVRDAQGHPLSGQNVLFSSSDSGETLGTARDNGDGTYTATITSSAVAHRVTITATDLSVSPNIVGQALLNQTTNSSTTSLLALEHTLVTNQGVSLVATVTSSSSSAPPSGTMEFDDHGLPISGCANIPVVTRDQTKIITCQASFAAATSPGRITAVFKPATGSSVAGSTSATEVITVGRTSSSTDLQLSSSTINPGGSVTFTATVTPGTSGPTAPTGSIVFLDGKSPIGTCKHQPLTKSGGFVTATCKVTYKTIGKHSIKAGYGGDANFNGSTSSAQGLNVHPTPAHCCVTAGMHWTFFFSPSYTKVLALIVNNVPPGAIVIVGCHGRGCPFKSTTIAVKATRCKATNKHNCPVQRPVTMQLAGRFRARHLGVGTKITVQIVRKGWIGKYYGFTVLPRRGPSNKKGCLAPGSSRPGVGC